MGKRDKKGGNATTTGLGMDRTFTSVNARALRGEIGGFRSAQGSTNDPGPEMYIHRAGPISS